MNRHYSAFFAAALLAGVFTGCVGPEQSTGTATADAHNPASDRMAALAGLPSESDIPSGGVVPNPAPLVNASRIAAANAEVAAVKAAARGYLVDKPYTVSLSSGDLPPSYAFGAPKARYQLGLPAVLVTRVDSLPGGWLDMVFSLSQQKWVGGHADNDHENDQDIP